MIGVGVGVGGQGMMGPGQPVVVGGPAKGGAAVPGR
jgi:transcription factor SPT20